MHARGGNLAAARVVAGALIAMPSERGPVYGDVGQVHPAVVVQVAPAHRADIRGGHAKGVLGPRARAAPVLVDPQRPVVQVRGEDVQVAVAIEIRGVRRAGSPQLTRHRPRRPELSAAVVLEPADLMTALTGEEHVRIPVAVQVGDVDTASAGGGRGQQLRRAELPAAQVLVPAHAAVVEARAERLQVPVAVEVRGVHRARACRRRVDDLARREDAGAQVAEPADAVVRAARCEHVRPPVSVEVGQLQIVAACGQRGDGALKTELDLGTGDEREQREPGARVSGIERAGAGGWATKAARRPSGAHGNLSSIRGDGREGERDEARSQRRPGADVRLRTSAVPIRTALA